MTKQESFTGIKPTKTDRVIMWFIRNIPRINLIVQAGLGEAFDKGIQIGFSRGARINGKSSQRKAKKALKDLYKVPAGEA
tara:strand:+ start:298 stop:537 length:240 start_codon:yes stop_codon:yes gene_type:complete